MKTLLEISGFQQNAGKKYGIVAGNRKSRGYYPVSNIRWKPIVVHLLRLFIGTDPGFGNAFYGMANALGDDANNKQGSLENVAL